MYFYIKTFGLIHKMLTFYNSLIFFHLETLSNAIVDVDIIMFVMGTWRPFIWYTTTLLSMNVSILHLLTQKWLLFPNNKIDICDAHVIIFNLICNNLTIWNTLAFAPTDLIQVNYLETKHRYFGCTLYDLSFDMQL